MEGRRVVTGAFVVALALAAGCRGNPAPAEAARAPEAVPSRVHRATPRDAGAPASQPLDTSTFTVRVVAALAAPVELHAWGESRVAVDAGLFVYEAKDEGLVLLGEPAEYAHDAGGDDLVGLATKPPPRTGWGSESRRITSGGERLLVAESDTVRAWDGARWRVTHDVDPSDVTHDKREEAPMAVSRDGAVWSARGAHVYRAPDGGPATEVALPEPEATLARPHFVGEFPDILTAVHAMTPSGVKYWQSTWLETPPVLGRWSEVVQIAPKRDGTVWIVRMARGDSIHWSTVLYRWGPPRVTASVVGTVFDQQVAVRNARGARPWDPKCPQAFVVAAGDASAARTAVSALAKRQAKRNIAVHLVEGRLGERVVRGVLLYAREPFIRPLVFGAAVDEADALVSGGGPTERTCSVPVVTREL
jgi:hypothetical protein